MTAGDGEYPDVPTDRLDAGGWELAEQTVSTVFRLPTAEIRDHRLVYEDADLRRAVREATDGALDQPWRLFFASRLTFRPPLAPGVGPASVRPTVEAESKRAFADELRERGFENVERGRRQRMRTDEGDRAGLTKFSAEFAVTFDGGPREIAVEGWLAVWTRQGTFRVSGGAYPGRGLDSILGDESAENRYFRDELLELVRGVR
jgi:hypothetical protein